MRPFTNNHGWANDGAGRGFDSYPRALPPRYHVYCLSCFAWMGQSTARLEDAPQEWKCNICRRVTYPNTRSYLHRLEGKGKVLTGQSHAELMEGAQKQYKCQRCGAVLMGNESRGTICNGCLSQIVPHD